MKAQITSVDTRVGLVAFAKGVDQIGVARTTLAPSGQVFIRGEYWDAVGPGKIREGERVRVSRVDGMTLHVEPASPPDVSSA
jgi:membrane-bound serine protease (ClpP class)